jgi:hypothetical protein
MHRQEIRWKGVGCIYVTDYDPLTCFSQHGNKFPVRVWEILDGTININSARTLRSELRHVIIMEHDGSGRRVQFWKKWESIYFGGERGECKSITLLEGT